MAKRKVTTPSKIEPGTLYAMREFFRVSGIGWTTVYSAEKLGVEFPKFGEGRHRYVLGSDGIKFLIEYHDAVKRAREAAAEQLEEVV